MEIAEPVLLLDLLLVSLLSLDLLKLLDFGSYTFC